MDYSYFEEKRCGGELIYDGRIVHLWRDEIILPNGKPGIREVSRHNGAVAVVPLTSEGEVICVKQFRYPFADVLLEIPAGKLDSKEEDHIDAVKRELREETGVLCKSLTYIGPLYPSVALSDEVIHMYVATELEYTEPEPDEDEFLEVLRIPLNTLIEMIMSGELPDSKTQVALLKTARLIEQGKIKY